MDTLEGFVNPQASFLLTSYAITEIKCKIVLNS